MQSQPFTPIHMTHHPPPFLKQWGTVYGLTTITTLLFVCKCMQMPQIIPLSTLTLVHMWYEESTLQAIIAHIGVELLTSINMGSILKLMCTRLYTTSLATTCSKGTCTISNICSTCHKGHLLWSMLCSYPGVWTLHWKVPK